MNPRLGCPRCSWGTAWIIGAFGYFPNQPLCFKRSRHHYIRRFQHRNRNNAVDSRSDFRRYLAFDNLGASGTDTGTITCSFTSNTGASVRTATIRITASGATCSPVDVTVTQAGAGAGAGAGAELIAASFVGSGLWIYNSGNAAWSQISSINP